MLKIIKQFFCSHNSIETTSESGLNAIDQGYFFVKTLISCSKCGKSFAQHPRQMCCYVMHLQYEMIRECILNRVTNQMKAFKQ